MTYILGFLGFFLLYIYEFNLILWKRKFLKLFFSIGFIALGSATVLAILSSWSYVQSNIINVIVGIGFCIVFFMLLIYTLFFSVPFSESYVEQSDQRTTYSKGMYALSRHPGVLWFIGTYLGISIVIPSDEVIYLSVLLIVLNIIYVIIQDVWSFPRLFVDYNQYKNKTPFLIPTINSLKEALKR